MFDDLERLREHLPLQVLFEYYGTRGEPNRESWHARLSELPDVSAAEMSRLHGELIAFDWIEQNTGQMPCCYRVTVAGMRAFRQWLTSREEQEPLPIQQGRIEEIEKQAA
jgi:hypothetical protein